MRQEDKRVEVYPDSARPYPPGRSSVGWRSRRGGMTTRATPRGDGDAVRLAGLFDSHDLWRSLTARAAAA
jgi:hypothetical protein